MFTATIRTIGGQEIKLDELSVDEKDKLVDSIGTEARFVRNTYASVTVVNLATVESINIGMMPLQPH